VYLDDDFHDVVLVGSIEAKRTGGIFQRKTAIVANTFIGVPPVQAGVQFVVGIKRFHRRGDGVRVVTLTSSRLSPLIAARNTGVVSRHLWPG